MEMVIHTEEMVIHTEEMVVVDTNLMPMTTPRKNQEVNLLLK
jgi:hypothetical protein